MSSSMLRLTLPQSLLALILLAILVRPADAQTVRLAHPDAFQADFGQRDQSVFVDELALDQDQAATVSGLIEQYLEEFEVGRAGVRRQIGELNPAPKGPNAEYRAAQERMRERLAALRDEMRERAAATTDPDEQRRILDEFRDRMEEAQRALAEFGPTGGAPEELAEAMKAIDRITADWIRTKARLRDTMLEHVQLLLTEEQAPRWPSLVRRLRRDKTIQRAGLRGESLDLLKVVANFSMSDEQRAAIGPALDAYAVRFDGALLARNTFVEERGGELVAAQQARDPETVRSLAMRQFDLHAAVRDLNREYVLVVASALGSELGTAFEEDFYGRVLPRIYGPTRASRLFAAAQGWPQLDEEVRDRLDRLVEEYTLARAAANVAARDLVFQREPGQRVTALVIAATEDRARAAAVEDVVRVARVQLRELDEAFIARLRALLGDDIYLRLPGVQTSSGNTPRPRRDVTDPGRERYEKMLKLYDENGDGRLTGEERQNVRRHFEREQEGGG